MLFPARGNSAAVAADDDDDDDDEEGEGEGEEEEGDSMPPVVDNFVVAVANDSVCPAAGIRDGDLPSPAAASALACHQRQ